MAKENTCHEPPITPATDQLKTHEIDRAKPAAIHRCFAEIAAETVGLSTRPERKSNGASKASLLHPTEN